MQFRGQSPCEFIRINMVAIGRNVILNHSNRNDYIFLHTYLDAAWARCKCSFFIFVYLSKTYSISKTLLWI